MLPVKMTSGSEVKPRFSKAAAVFWLLRLNRTVMVAMITGTTAFMAGRSAREAILIGLGGWCLAVGGFSLDFLADRELDKEGPRAKTRHNPFTDGSLPPAAGLAFSLSFTAASFVLILLLAPRALIPWGVILLVITGLARHWFEHPLSRAFTLGLLQGLYALLGGMTGLPSPGIGILAGMFFFAMFGGRGMTDIRDFPQDKETRVMTLPKRYGIKGTARLTGICLFVAYALSLTAYYTGEFTPVYLYLDIFFILIGTATAVLFMIRPSPRLAFRLTLVSMMGMGTVICLAIILGSR